MPSFTKCLLNLILTVSMYIQVQSSTFSAIVLNETVNNGTRFAKNIGYSDDILSSCLSLLEMYDAEPKFRWPLRRNTDVARLTTHWGHESFSISTHPLLGAPEIMF